MFPFTIWPNRSLSEGAFCGIQAPKPEQYWPVRGIFLASPNIFLSDNREDSVVARRYADAFAAEGLNVWRDTALRAGGAHDEVAEAALRGARAVVVPWSPRAMVSCWLRAEATAADRQKTLVPGITLDFKESIPPEACRPRIFPAICMRLLHWSGRRRSEREQADDR